MIKQLSLNEFQNRMNPKNNYMPFVALQRISSEIAKLGTENDFY